MKNRKATRHRLKQFLKHLILVFLVLAKEKDLQKYIIKIRWQ